MAALCALGLGIAMAGCASKQAGAPANGLAASFAAGRAFDRAQSALRSSSDTEFGRAGRDFNAALAQLPRQNNGLSGVLAAQLASAAIQLDTQAQGWSYGATALRERAMRKYRAANAALPAQIAPGAVDAFTLNAVGYALADRGTNRADWTRAAQLTRLSLDEWDRRAKLLGANDARRASLQAARNNTLDSHAWALFRLGQWKQARKEQERVMAFARANPSVLGPELPYHMAEIYRALGRDDDATREYQAALDLNPDPELALKIDAALNGKIV